MPPTPTTTIQPATRFATETTEPRFRVRTGGNWQEQAECRRRGVPVDLFFAEETDLTAVATARIVCNACSVRAQCLQFAMESGSEGLWAGTTEVERRRLRVAARAAAS